MKIAWTGISSQRDRHGHALRPLSAETQTGKIVERIIRQCPPEFSHKRANFIDSVLVDDRKRLRPPSDIELSAGLERFVGSLKRKRKGAYVFFGGHIRGAFQNRYSAVRLHNEVWYRLFNSALIFVHHPSYIRIYRSKHLEKYIHDTAAHVSSGRFEGAQPLQ